MEMIVSWPHCGPGGAANLIYFCPDKRGHGWKLMWEVQDAFFLSGQYLFTVSVCPKWRDCQAEWLIWLIEGVVNWEGKREDSDRRRWRACLATDYTRIESHLSVMRCGLHLSRQRSVRNIIPLLTSPKHWHTGTLRLLLLSLRKSHCVRHSRDFVACSFLYISIPGEETLSCLNVPQAKKPFPKEKNEINKLPLHIFVTFLTTSGPSGPRSPGWQ